MGDKDKEVLKKATESLDEGAKALATRQKHIQLADRSEFGWSTVRYYEADPLASDLDDEKSIKKAEKETQRDVEKKMAARKRRACRTAATDAGVLVRIRATSQAQVTGGMQGNHQLCQSHRVGQEYLGLVSGVGHLGIWQPLALPKRNCILFASLW